MTPQVTPAQATREIANALADRGHVVAVGPPGDCASFANKCRSAGFRPRTLLSHGSPSVVVAEKTSGRNEVLARLVGGGRAVPGHPDVIMVGKARGGTVELPVIFIDALKMISKSAKGSAPSSRSKELMKNRVKSAAKRPAPPVVKSAQVPSLESQVLRRMLVSCDPVQREAARARMEQGVAA